ncbi:hypothetical protein ABFA07_021669 [Porites harrisoni]
MAETVGGKNLETQLKKVALASACTLTGPTVWEPSDEGNFVRESLEDKVRRVRQGGSVYKWDGKEDELVNNMAETVDGKTLETQLKKVALASACTLTGPTGFEPPYGDEDFERLEDRVRRVRPEGTVYKWDLKK